MAVLRVEATMEVETRGGEQSREHPPRAYERSQS